VSVFDLQPGFPPHQVATPCQDDPELFFPAGSGYYVAPARAVALCGSCPVFFACREFGVVHADEGGVWGGLTQPQRRRARARRMGVAS